ncbi:MAG: type IV pilus secretin PilQ [Desulfobacterales bacterium]|nr:MAG: type IV pilus secretin PilQ [Desulfobacterales bacterium]
METNYHKNRIVWGLFCLSLSFVLIWGCASPKKETKDPFFEEWKARAEELKGYSPAPPAKVDEKYLEITKKIVPKLEKPEKEKPLPKRKISLKMTDIEVGVLLRALSRAANQNIIVSEKVKGSINITQAPWDQVFLGILRTHGLSYTWEGEIIRIMTADDMEADLKREARQRELKIAEPPLTRIVPIKFSEAEKLKSNLDNFLTLDKNDKPIGSILVDEHTNSLIIQAIRHDLATILTTIEQLDKPTPQVMIEAYIVEANKDVARELGIQWGGLIKSAKGTGVVFGTGRDSGALGGGISDPVDPKSGLVVDLPADSIGGLSPFTLGAIYQNIGDMLLAVQLSALQEQGKLNILSSPSITTLDNQMAYIESGRDIPYQTVEDGEVNIEYKKATLKLEVTPHVIDNKTLKMFIKVKKDEVDFTQQVLGNPTIITKEAETNVIQFDGQTFVIGGLNKETTSDSRSGVPLLEDIPGLGYLFKKKSSSNEMEDLLIFITPHILKPPLGSG